MNRFRSYIKGLITTVYGRGVSKNTGFALAGGIPCGPLHDPKGDFYNVKLGVRWHQPEGVTLMEDTVPARSRIKGLMGLLGIIRKSA